MQFTPDESDKDGIEVPFYGSSLRAADGWSGHAGGKSVPALKSELSAALGRLDAAVTGFQRGTFTDENSGVKREGIVVSYSIPTASGELWPGKIPIAALPVDRESCQNDSSYEVKIDKALRMALFMTITAVRGAWNMRVLSPGYSPLVPWMITGDDGKTFSEKFSIMVKEDQVPKLPAGDPAPEVIIGDFTEVED